MKEKKPSLLKRFAHYYTPYKKTLAVDVFMSTVITACSLVYPMITRKIINEIVPAGNLKALILSAVAVLVIYTVKMIANRWVGFYGHMLGVDIQNDMQKDIFSHLLDLPYTFFDEHKTGSLMSRVYNDLSDITELAHHGPEYLIQTLGTLIGSFVILCFINWRLAVIVFCSLPAMLLLLSSLRIKMNEGYNESRKAVSEINAELSNSLGGIRVAKAFDNKEGEMRKFDRRAGDFKKARVLAFSAMSAFNTGMEYILDIMYLIVLTAGGIFYFKGIISIGDFTAFFLYISAFLTPVRKLMSFVEMLEDGKTGFSRFCEIMDIDSEYNKPEAKDATDLTGDIVFDNVSFAYSNNEEQKVLDGLTLKIENGKKVALVGPSGGGKTTMCHLIPRFYDLQNGSISVAGTDIENYTRSSIRRNIGIVQQDVFLFTGTVADNIAYAAPDATEEEIKDAARKARIDEFIESLPHGYDTYVGERGVMLSGGQKQRIAIARIFLKNPQILILDEATSALDNVTEAQLQESLDELAAGRTTIVVAHRLSTVRNADKIYFLTDEGIAEEGSHTELMAMGGAYASLYRSQFSEEQLKELISQ